MTPRSSYVLGVQMTSEIWETTPGKVDLPTGLPRPLYEGKPVPFTAKLQSRQGRTVPDFSNVHKPRMNRCLTRNLCILCGDPLEDTCCVIGRYRGGQTLASAMEFIDEGVLHERCARMAKAHCPELKPDSFQILTGPTADLEPHDVHRFRKIPEMFRLLKTNHPVPKTVIELDAKAGELTAATT